MVSNANSAGITQPHLEDIFWELDCLGKAEKWPPNGGISVIRDRDRGNLFILGFRVCQILQRIDYPWTPSLVYSMLGNNSFLFSREKRTCNRNVPLWEAKKLNEYAQLIFLFGHQHLWKWIPLRHQDINSIFESYLESTHFFLPP